MPIRALSRDDQQHSFLDHSRPGHAAAFVSTVAARLGAALAMFSLMLLAFGSAGIANVGAKATELLHEVRSPAHISRCGPADFGTVTIQPDALGHQLHVQFLQAGVGTVFAFLCTLYARLNAGLILLMSHSELLFRKLRCWTNLDRLIKNLQKACRYAARGTSFADCFVLAGVDPMVTMHFFRADGREVHKAGPFPWVRASDGLLQAGPDGEEVARYYGGVWTVEGHDVVKCIVHCSTCTARFEGDSPDDSITFGPFERVEFMDGSLYPQPGRRLLARFDEIEQESQE